MSKEPQVYDLVLWWDGNNQKYILGMIVGSRNIDFNYNTIPIWDVEWFDTKEVCVYTISDIMSMRERYEEYESSRKASSQA